MATTIGRFVVMVVVARSPTSMVGVVRLGMGVGVSVKKDKGVLSPGTPVQAVMRTIQKPKAMAPRLRISRLYIYQKNQKSSDFPAFLIIGPIRRSERGILPGMATDGICRCPGKMSGLSVQRKCQ